MHSIIPLFLMTFLAISNTASSQVPNVELWPDKIPGRVENGTYPDEVSDSGDNWMKTRFVTRPRLDCYPADPANYTGTAVIICPGGGYGVLAVGHEGEQLARWFNTLGISAFVLKYRLPHDAIMADKSIGPLQDAQEAVRLLRRRAKEWKIDPRKIGIMGFSAGGHLASTASTHYHEKVYEPADSTSARPDFSLLIYPVISMNAAITHMGSRENLLGKNPSEEQVKRFSNELQVNGQTPPAFLVHSIDDGAVPVQNSIAYALALDEAGVPCELHIYQQGGHGYGMGRSNHTESSWPEACRKWLNANGFGTSTF